MIIAPEFQHNYPKPGDCRWRLLSSCHPETSLSLYSPTVPEIAAPGQTGPCDDRRSQPITHHTKEAHAIAIAAAVYYDVWKRIVMKEVRGQVTHNDRQPVSRVDFLKAR